MLGTSIGDPPIEKFNFRAVSIDRYVIETWTDNGWYYPNEQMKITLRLLRRDDQAELPDSIHLKVTVKTSAGEVVLSKEVDLKPRKISESKRREVVIVDGQRGDPVGPPNVDTYVQDSFTIKMAASEREYLMDISGCFSDRKAFEFATKALIIQRLKR